MGINIDPLMSEFHATMGRSGCDSVVINSTLFNHLSSSWSGGTKKTIGRVNVYLDTNESFFEDRSWIGSRIAEPLVGINLRRWLESDGVAFIEETSLVNISRENLSREQDCLSCLLAVIWLIGEAWLISAIHRPSFDRHGLCTCIAPCPTGANCGASVTIGGQLVGEYDGFIVDWCRQPFIEFMHQARKWIRTAKTRVAAISAIQTVELLFCGDWCHVFRLWIMLPGRAVVR